MDSSQPELILVGQDGASSDPCGPGGSSFISSLEDWVKKLEGAVAQLSNQEHEAMCRAYRAAGARDFAVELIDELRKELAGS